MIVCNAKRICSAIVLSFLFATHASAEATGDIQSLSEHLEGVMQSAVNEGFTGVALVGRGDRIIFDFAHGLAGTVPIRTSSRFWIASAGKQFTSALVLKCQEEGLLSLDDTIGDFFPNAPADKQAITLRQLLSHQSGLPQGYETEVVSSAAEAISVVMSLPLIEPPGTGFNYSNNNYQLAVAIIETVTGKPYAEVLRNAFLEPLSLHNIGQADAGDSKSVLPAISATPERLMRSSWGGQGFYASADDLWTWFQALQSGVALRSQSVDELMMKGLTPISEGEAALGWFVGDNDYGHLRVFTRGNEGFGPNSLIYFYPESKLLIIVLTHAGPLDGQLSFSRAVHAEIESVLEQEHYW